jgi:predicted nucleotidyltransferase
MNEDYHIFYEVISGSRAYGFANENSDLDIRAIAFPSYEKFFGLGAFEFSKTDSPDKQVFSLRKFTNLALNANPNILELLFIDDKELILFDSNWARDLKNIRDKFITKKIFTTYMGYVTAQIHKLKNDGNCGPKMGSKRFEGIKKYGYDTKAAAHIIRLLNQGLDLAIQGKIYFPLNEAVCDNCIRIRAGKFSFDELIEHADSLIEVFRALEQTSDLPEAPNFKAVDTLIQQMHYAFYTYELPKGELQR